jgi:protease YdgD
MSKMRLWPSRRPAAPDRRSGARAARAALALLALVGASAPAHASDALPGIIGADDRTPERSNDLPWIAIGRVNREVGGFCTGVLVGPRTALTAAHCLWNSRTNQWLPPDTIHFVLGWRGGQHVAHARVIHVRASPGLMFDIHGKPTRLIDDWALIELDGPLGDEIGSLPMLSVEPSAAVAFAANRDAVSAAGYSQDRPHLLYRQGVCRLSGTSDGGRLLLHDCDLTRGTSGAPIMIERDGRYSVIAVQVGVVKRNGEERGVAVIPITAEARRVN